MFSIYLLPMLTAMFLAVNMGGSGISPSFSSVYGAKIINRSLISGLYGIAVLLGAILAGGRVTETISAGILPRETMGIAVVTVILLATGLSILLANLLGVPQSTSQTTVFALVGVALYFGNLKLDKLLYEIIPAWFLLPVAAFFIMYLIGRFIYYPVRKMKWFKQSKIRESILLKGLVILSSCYVAFSIGANNVANAAGPIFSLLDNELVFLQDNPLLLQTISILIIAPCFGIGGSIFGPRVLETTGEDIINIGLLGATGVSLVTATLLLLASVLRGIPTNLVQLNTAAILGLGIVKTGRLSLFSKPVVKRVFSVWIVSPLIALVLAYLFVFGVDRLLGLA